VFSGSVSPAQRWQSGRCSVADPASRFEKAERAGRYANTSLNALREGARSISDAKLKSRSRLNVGIVPAVAANLLPLIVKHFRKHDLDVILNLQSGCNSELLDRLQVGELDMVIGRPGEMEQTKGLLFEHLYCEAICLVARPDHPLLRGDFAAFTLLHPPRNTLTCTMIDNLMLTMGVNEISDRIETLSDLFARECVRHCNTVRAVSRGVVQHDIQNRDLIELPLLNIDTRASIGFSIRADRSPNVQLQAFMDTARQSAQELNRHDSSSPLRLADRIA
jgi:LysR family transcriptional regulator, pca operon transcriptional activator